MNESESLFCLGTEIKNRKILILHSNIYIPIFYISNPQATGLPQFLAKWGVSQYHISLNI